LRVQVQLFATLAAFLPPESREGAAILEVPEASTVREVIRRLGVPADFERVVLVNGEDATADRALRADDVVAVFPPLSGGARPARRPVA
jgi:molybdopterin converting factor small subunit